MPTSLVSTGVQFPDSTIQTTAATAGADPGMVLISSTNATAVTTIDINFSASYNNYIIVSQGLQPSSVNQTMYIRFFVGGVIQTGTVYGRNSGTNVVGAGQDFLSSAFIAVNAAGNTSPASAEPSRGMNFFINMHGVNNSQYKYLYGNTSANLGSSLSGQLFAGSYNGTSALTGIRFYWSGGDTFAAQGSIKLYGLKNS
jgi:hypothetical protein